MIQTAPRTVPGFLGPEFNRFLFAPVGTDRFGGQLSVVSALARLDLDAWAEAASLAILPRDTAVAKLAAMLRHFTEIPRIGQDSGAVAARLIALLPAGAAPAFLSNAAPGRWAAATGGTLLAFVVTFAILFGVQYANHALTPQASPAGHRVTPAALAAPPAPPPP